MKTILNTIKTIILTGTIAILTSIPAFAQEHTPNTVNAIVTYADSQIIEAEYNNKTYIVERGEEDNDQWNVGETIVLDLNAEDTHEALNGQYKGTVIQTYPEKNNLVVIKVDNDIYSFYADDNSYKVNNTIELTFKDDEIINANKINNYNVQIQSINYLDNSITIEKDSQLYKFYVNEPRNYYLDETINVTMDSSNKIIDCKVIDKPQIYNTQISQVKGTIAMLTANGETYIFDNTEGADGWKTGDKCKAIIQDGKLLEVNPIPLVER